LSGLFRARAQALSSKKKRGLKMQRIGVIGAGHVGLVTAAVFADLGNKIICQDSDRQKIKKLKKGDLPIYEPGLSKLIKKNVKAKRLSFTHNLPEVVNKCFIIFICVGTPPRQDGSADLSSVENVTRKIAQNMKEYKIIVGKSTVPVETGEWIRRTILMHNRRKVEFSIVSNPEFLREGSAIKDTLYPDRIVLGVEDKKAEKIMRELFKPIKAPIVVTNIKTAEMIKHASNSFLATKISFINAVGHICEKVGADVIKVADGMGLDRRIGRAFLNAGAGFGGFCLRGSEKVIVKEINDRQIQVLSMRDLYKKIANKERYEVLSFDINSKRVKFSKIILVSQRKFSGKLVTIKTRMNKTITATDDHPFIIYEKDGFRKVLAKDLKEGDFLPVFLKLPERGLRKNLNIDLINELQNRRISIDNVKVRPKNKEFKDYKDIILKDLRKINRNKRWRPEDILNNNCMSLKEYLLLEKKGKIPIDRSELSLFTSKGNTTYSSAIITLDKNFCRLLGYYASEGHIHQEQCERGERSRIIFHFNRKEYEYIDDVCNILDNLGISYRKAKQSQFHTVSIIISSRIFAFLIKDVLKCGIDSYTAQIPEIIYSLNKEKKEAFLSGTFRGDGHIAFPQNTQAIVYDFGSISLKLIQGMEFLFHTLGIVPSYKRSRSQKATNFAHFIRISGRDQIKALPLFKDRDMQRRVDQRLLSYKKHIKPTGFKRINSHFGVVKIKKIKQFFRKEEVYSLEVKDTGTFVTGNGLIIHNCFPKDLEAFIYIAKKAGYDFSLLRETAKINREQKQFLVKKVEEAVWIIPGKTIGVLGLSFKPNTDDIRFSVSIDVIRMLQKEGAKIKAYDPQAMQEAKKELKDVKFCRNPYEATRNSDCLLIMTEWDEFRNLDLARIKRLLRQPILIDGRNIFEPEQMNKLGFIYKCIGR
jgi:UDPglucose 6-dehydrogenase